MRHEWETADGSLMTHVGPSRPQFGIIANSRRFDTPAAVNRKMGKKVAYPFLKQDVPSNVWFVAFVYMPKNVGATNQV